MTTADLIAVAAVAITFLVNGAGWLLAIGGWRRELKQLREDSDRHAAQIATMATQEQAKEMVGRVEVLEKDMREVHDLKQQLKSHADLTTSKFEAMTQQARDGFDRVASEVRSFDRLISSQLDEIRHRLRDPTT